MENEPKKRSSRAWIIILAIIAVMAAAGLCIFLPRGESADNDAYETFTVVRDSVVSTITGDGKLAAADNEEIKLPDGIEVDDIIVSKGDSVKAGDALVSLDRQSLTDKAAALSAEISSLDRELSQLAANKTEEAIYAPVAGRIKYMPAAKGSDVLSVIKESGLLALISVDGHMRIDVTTDTELALYGEVKIIWPEGSDTGVITAKTADGYTILLDDEKAPYLAEAKIYDGERLIGSGIINISSPLGVYGLGGKISKVHYEIDDKVSAAAKLFTIDNGTLSSAYQIKYSQRSDKAEQLCDVLALIDDPVLTAPTDGVVSAINIAEGAYTGMGMQSAQGESTAFVLSTGGAVKMTVSVNELDINSILVGQPAELTIDALPGDVFSAEVERISGIGHPDGSLTVYDVELTIEYDERLREGMSSNATITTGESADAIVVPLAAINEDSEGEYVYVGEAREKRYIRTGLSDGEKAEVLEGLSEGETVEYLASAAPLFGFPYSFRSGTSFPTMSDFNQQMGGSN